MTKEEDKSKRKATGQSSELPKRKFVVDSFAKLTDHDWIDAMERGRKAAEPRNEEIRKALKGDDKES